MSTNIKVLGTGCANCKTTLKLIEEVAAAKGVAVQLEKVEDIQAIMGYGVMSTPGVVIDGKVVHAGGVPSRDKIAGWLAGNTAAAAPSTAGGCCSGGKCA
jgi:small redox-active disulfide protein 2